MGYDSLVTISLHRLSKSVVIQIMNESRNERRNADRDGQRRGYKDRVKTESNGMARVKGVCLYNNASSQNRLCYIAISSALEQKTGGGVRALAGHLVAST